MEKVAHDVEKGKKTSSHLQRQLNNSPDTKGYHILRATDGRP